jgi:outer membrane receptor protein involved in Fe transport
LNFNKNLNSNFSFNLDAGANSRRFIFSQTGQSSSQQLVYGIFNHAKFVTPDVYSESGAPLNYDQQTLSLGLFAQGTLGYKEYAFLTVGGRNSLFSTVEKPNRSIFYPSVSLAYIPTAAIESLKGNQTVNYLKLRVGYSPRANPPSPYSTRAYLNTVTRAFVTNGGTTVSTNSNSTLLPNPNIKPEMLREIETGAEGRFFDNSLTMDLTLYYRIAKDHILFRSLDP